MKTEQELFDEMKEAFIPVVEKCTVAENARLINAVVAWGGSMARQTLDNFMAELKGGK